MDKIYCSQYIFFYILPVQLIFVYAVNRPCHDEQKNDRIKDQNNLKKQD